MSDFSLLVKLAADSSAFDAGLRSAAQQSRQFGKEAQAMFEATRTPAERYKISVDKVTSAYQAGRVDVDTYRRSLQRLQDELRETAVQAKAVPDALGKIKPLALASLGAMGVGVGVGEVISFAKQSVAAFEEARLQQKKLEAVLQATGHSAGFSAKALGDYASQLQRITNFDDDAIAGAQAILATFKQIRGDEFTHATRAMLDLSTVMEQDLKSSALQVGKALQDPLHGITALHRAGVTFNEEQKRLIAGFVETNQLAKAQGLILQEIDTQMDEAAKAVRSEWKGLANDVGDLKEAIGSLSQSRIAIFGVQESSRQLRQLTADIDAAGLQSEESFLSLYRLANTLNPATYVVRLFRGETPEAPPEPPKMDMAPQKGKGKIPGTPAEMAEALAGEAEHREAIGKTIAAIENEIRTIRMSAEEKKLDALATAGATKEELAHYEALLKTDAKLRQEIAAQTAADEAKRRASQTADDYLAKLRLEADMVGKSADEQERLRLAIAGVTAERLRDIEAAQNALKAKQKTQAELDEFFAMVEKDIADNLSPEAQAAKAESLKNEFSAVAERNKSALEKAAEQLQKDLAHLKDLEGKGLDKDLAAKDRARLQREFRELEAAAKNRNAPPARTSENRALLRGTSEAFSAVNRANDRKTEEKLQKQMLDVERGQLVEAKKTNRALANVGRWGN